WTPSVPEFQDYILS
ncbi:unnamed protein product, partial [Allacma fusca]